VSLLIIRPTSLLDEPPSWADEASCAGMDPEAFFGPERAGRGARAGDPGRAGYAPEPEWVAEAKAICRRCPIQTECLSRARSRGERYGVWGGVWLGREAAS
jgi:WhiB family transcriptional regulator, redox-sensing transcriptional regulator